MRKILVVLAIVAGFMFTATPANAASVTFQQTRPHPTIGASVSQVRDCVWIRKDRTGPWHKRVLPRPTNAGKSYLMRKAQRAWYRAHARRVCSNWYTPHYAR